MFAVQPESNVGEVAGPTGALASFAAGFSLNDAPGRIRDRAKHLLLDGLGCAVVGARTPWSSVAVSTVEKLEGGGPATVIGWDLEVPVPAAALLNGTFIQGLEIDDYHPTGGLHSSALVVPSVLATAQGIGGCTGRDLLESLVLGFEVGPRVCSAMRAFDAISRGFNPGGIFGSIPAAIAAGRLRRLDAVGFSDAIGIAATQGAGLMSAQYGSMVKRMLHGFSSRAGVYAAALAAEGYSGIRDVLEQEYGGLFSSFLGDATPRWDILTANLGEQWAIESIAVKPYAAMAGTHAAIEAAIRIAQRASLDGVDILGIVIRLPRVQMLHGGWTLHRPAEMTGAQINHAYAVAVALLDRQVLIQQFTPDRLSADEIWDLIGKTVVEHDSELDGLGGLSARLEIQLRGGVTEREEVLSPLGVGSRRLTNSEIRQKFVTLAEPVMGTRRMGRLERAVAGLEDTSLSELIALLKGEVASPW